MKNYADMTEQEINALVAVANGLNVQERSIIGIGRIPVVVKLFRGVEDLTSVPDYCNNWADAGPVILYNLICLVSPVIPRDEWIATWSSDGGMWSVNDFTCRNKNPLRAAMIVFLMMKDNETRILAPGEVSDE